LIGLAVAHLFAESTRRSPQCPVWAAADDEYLQNISILYRSIVRSIYPYQPAFAAVPPGIDNGFCQLIAPIHR